MNKWVYRWVNGWVGEWVVDGWMETCTDRKMYDWKDRKMESSVGEMLA